MLLKAAAGGGGKGMRLVDQRDELATPLGARRARGGSASATTRSTSRSASSARATSRSRCSAIAHGNLVHLVERDCSIQRRHQKVVEETPVAGSTPGAARRDDRGGARGRRAAVGYCSAGTFEFLLAQDGSFYFLEMNTRLQVEHPITELVTGIDLVAAQVRVAARRAARLRQEDIVPRGHAHRVPRLRRGSVHRLPAERRERSSLVREPTAPGVRVDSGIDDRRAVPVDYDPLLAKLSVWAPTGDAARRRMRAALREYVVLGCTTATSRFLHDLLAASRVR